MKKEIEVRHKMKWDEAYILNCNKNVPSGISDYETYAQWMIYNYPHEVTCKPFYNTSINRKEFLEQNENIRNYPIGARSLSLHSYN